MQNDIEQAGHELINALADRVLDQATENALSAALGVTQADIKAFMKGNTPKSIKALRESLRAVQSMFPNNDKASGLSWLQQAEADGDLSRHAKSVAKWLNQHGNGEVKFKYIALDLKLKIEFIRNSMNELQEWYCISIRP